MNHSEHDPQVYDWAYLKRIIFSHRAELIKGHLIAILTMLVSVPTPLMMPLLVDEVLLHKPGIVIHTLDPLTPVEWHGPQLYIGAVLALSLLLRCLNIIFTTLQLRQFAVISKDVIFHLRRGLIRRLKTLSMAEYESLGSGTVATYLVTDLETVDSFIGTSVSRGLVAILTIFGSAGVQRF